MGLFEKKKATPEQLREAAKAGTLKKLSKRHTFSARDMLETDVGTKSPFEEALLGEQGFSDMKAALDAQDSQMTISLMRQNLAASHSGLHIAARHKKLPEIKVLLGDDSYIPREVLHYPDMHGRGTFHLAAEHGCFDQIKDIIKPGEKLEPKNVQTSDLKNVPLLSSACANGHLDQIAAYFGGTLPFTRAEMIEKPNGVPVSPLGEAVIAGHLDQVLTYMKDEEKPVAKDIFALPKRTLHANEGAFLTAMKKHNNWSMKSLKNYMADVPPLETPAEKERLKKMNIATGDNPKIRRIHRLADIIRKELAQKAPPMLVPPPKGQNR